MATGAAVVGAGATLYGVYSANKNAKNAQKSIDKATAAQTEVMQQQLDMAEEQWDNYLTTFQPINEMLAMDARKGETANYDQRISEVNADVEQSYADAEGTDKRNMMRYGINPNDPRFRDLVKSKSLEKAKAKVGAVNSARQNERDRADKLTWAKRIDVANMGKGISSNAVSSLNSAGNSAQGMGRLASVDANLANQKAADSYKLSGAVVNIADRIAKYGDKNGWFEPSYKPGSNAGNWQENASGYSSGDGADWESDDGYGGYADGGEVTAEPKRKSISIGGHDFGGDHGVIDGPGTGVSDSVRAVVDGYRNVNLSDGEYIIPADVVKKKGTDFFDKMVNQDHTKVRG